MARAVHKSRNERKRTRTRERKRVEERGCDGTGAGRRIPFGGHLTRFARMSPCLEAVAVTTVTWLSGGRKRKAATEDQKRGGRARHSPPFLRCLAFSCVVRTRIVMGEDTRVVYARGARKCGQRGGGATQRIHASVCLRASASITRTSAASPPPFLLQRPQHHVGVHSAAALRQYIVTGGGPRCCHSSRRAAISAARGIPKCLPEDVTMKIGSKRFSFSWK